MAIRAPDGANNKLLWEITKTITWLWCTRWYRFIPGAVHQLRRGIRDDGDPTSKHQPDSATCPRWRVCLLSEWSGLYSGGWCSKVSHSYIFLCGSDFHVSFQNGADYIQVDGDVKTWCMQQSLSFKYFQLWIRLSCFFHFRCDGQLLQSWLPALMATRSKHHFSTFLFWQTLTKTDNNANNGNLLYLAKVAWRENLENGDENGFNLENITRSDVFR